MKKLDSKLQKQQQGWSKISNTVRKYNKDENLENYDSEVQMYPRAHSGPRLANQNHLRLRRVQDRVQNILHANFFMFILTLLQCNWHFFILIGTKSCYSLLAIIGY